MASADNKKNRQSSSRQSQKGGQQSKGTQAARRGGTATASRSTKQDKAVKDGKPKGGIGSRWSRSRERARQSTAKGGQKSERGLRKFLKDVRVELRKVTWPSRKDLFQSTLVVLVAVAISSAFIAVLDFIFSRLMNYMLP